MANMRTIAHKRGVLHVETPLGIINIHVGLTDAQGRAVEAIQILPDQLADKPPVRLRGYRLVQLKRIPKRKRKE